MASLPNRKIALISGVTGQEGACLAELLCGKGYDGHGIKLRSSLFNTDRMDHFCHGPHESSRYFVLHHGDKTDLSLFLTYREYLAAGMLDLGAGKDSTIEALASEVTALATFEDRAQVDAIMASGTPRRLRSLDHMPELDGWAMPSMREGAVHPCADFAEKHL